MTDNIKTLDRDGNLLNIAATERNFVQYPLNHLINAAGQIVDPATQGTAASILAATVANKAVGIADGILSGCSRRRHSTTPSRCCTRVAQPD